MHPAMICISAERHRPYGGRTANVQFTGRAEAEIDRSLSHDAAADLSVESVIYPAFYSMHLATLNKSMQRFVGFGISNSCSSAKPFGWW